MLYDISERKKAEEERAQLLEQLFHTQKMTAIGTLAGGIAHDFNNLLGVILGYASLVRRRLPPEDALQEPVRVMELSAQRAAELTRQLLQFARQQTRQVEHLDIAEVVGYVLKVVSETFDRRIQVKACLAPELPCIEGDPGQLELAILNLCINARDAMPQGGTLTVETLVVALGGEDAPVPVHCVPGEYVRIAIRDTGVGIKPELLQRIFEPFFTTKEPGKGSGLGLATVYAIVNGYGGFVRAASQVGHGSEFTVYLPVLSRNVQPSVREQPQLVEQGTGTVLVVDDEPFMLTFAEEALQELGYEVLTAENGTRACEIYAQHAGEIDCVLLDMVMPGMSGFETQQALCAINPHVKVALVSGYSDGAEADRARESGAATFLGKPYTVETLAQVLKTVQVGNGPDKDRGT
jgi:nitrogen-specific signal transduction histidine kinase